jgi:subtilisin family serine protease
MHYNHPLHRYARPLAFFMLLALLLSVSAPLNAQDTPTELPPSDVPTQAASPTETLPTETTPTDAPTTEPVVTNPQPSETPPAVEPTPSDVPTQETTFPEPTAAPTEAAPSAPPVFNLSAAVLDAVAGTPLMVQFSVSDEAGVVRIEANTTGAAGSVELVTTAPIETAPPYNTLAELTYLAPAEFIGMDSFSLTAIDAAGSTASVTVQVNVAPPAASAQPSDTPSPEPTATPVRDRELIINYNPAASEQAITDMLAALGAVEIERIPQIGAIKVLVPANVGDPASAMAAIQSNTLALAAGVTNIEPNFEYQIHMTPNDPLYTNQWGLQDGSGTYTYLAWDLSARDGSGVKVAVLDTGIDLQHPEFIGRTTPGWDFINDDNNPDDDHFHGTHVAGVIGAKTNNAVGIAGIAFNALLMPVKVCNSVGSCPIYETAAGIIHATDNGAKVINMSLGGPTISTTIEGAVAYAISRGVTVVASAGNDGGTGYNYPASFPGVISVAAHQESGATYGNGTSNNRIIVSAPGVSVFSTVPLEDGSYGLLTGTSMAAPHVSGIATLLISDRPTITPAQVKEAMICSALDVGAAGYDNDFGYGIAQADWAMNWRNNSSNCKIVQPNDNFENAARIMTAPFTQTLAIHPRSVSIQATDPADICGVGFSQTLWYSYTPAVSDFYQISTLGSSYDTVVGVYQGSQGALTEVDCNDDYAPGDFNNSSLLTTSLSAGQTYYLAVATFNVPLVDQVLVLDVRRALVLNAIGEENSPHIAYSGTWSRVAQTGASGGYVQQTTDNSAVLSFSFRGDKFDFSRTVGPTMGDIEVWIDGGLFTTINNRAAMTQANQLIVPTISLGIDPGAMHQVVLRRADPGAAGPIAVDRIRTFATSPTSAITSITDDRTAGRFLYQGGSFSQVTVPGSHLNTITQTSDAGARIIFRATGSSIIIFRNTHPTFDSMDVYVDGAFYGTVSNNGSTGQKVPFAISGLSPVTHVVLIENVSGTLQFDAAQALSPAALAAPTKTDERSANIVYGGIWTNVVSPGAYLNTTRSTTDSQAVASFDFTGNWFCIGYKQQTGGGDVDVFVDNVYFDTFTTDGPLGYGFQYCSPVLTDRRHVVRLEPFGGPVELDFIHPQRQIVITPTMGLVQETNAAIRYEIAFGNWFTVVGSSPGGYRFQGNSARYAVDEDARLSFYINGTGFILYTSVGPTTGDWEVYVDGVLWPIEFAGSSFNFIDLFNSRFRPMGFGITNLPPGIHHIELRAVNMGDFVDFDGVRVFP